MGIVNLNRVFRPHSIAVVGASDTPGKVGHTLLRNLITAGYKGRILPVNSRRPVIQGLPAVPNLRALSQPADLAILCTPAETIPNLIRECGEAGVGGVIIISAGFRETGASGATLEAELQAARTAFPAMRVLGPNCLGVICPRIGLNASFAADTPRHGQIALISQSGALCTSLLDWALQENIGFSHFVSIGNMLDVGFGDLIDYFGEDPETRSIILYIESISDARAFISASRAFSRTKPIVAYKAGRFAESARAAASHTGALAGEDAIFDAAFRRAGIERVFEMSDVFDCAELLARQRLPRGPRLAIVTNAGGPGVMATDALLSLRGELASLSTKTLEQLTELLPPGWSHSNPVDVLGDATPERFAKAVQIVLADEQVDAATIILTPQAMTDPTDTAKRVAAVCSEIRKPILASWIGGRRVQEGERALVEAGIPVYRTPEPAVQAFMHLWSSARNRQTLYETPRDISVTFAHDSAGLRGTLATLIQRTAGDCLSEADSKTLLSAYGIPVSRTVEAGTVDEALQVAAELGYPVAVKVLSPQITHKTDVGGVALNVRTAEGVKLAFDQVTAAAKSHRPDAEIRGVTLQKMYDASTGVELIAGMKRDATFGAVMMVGAGGILAELLQDRALELPPLNERLARGMIESLRIRKLLEGYRGRPPVCQDQLIEALIRLSYLIADHPEICELDVNPLLATSDGVIALDARVILDRTACVEPPRAYSHLAIRPYPTEFVRQTTLADGTPVRLRPIRPEDIPLWLKMLNECSTETLHSRFRYLFKQATHEMAARYCFQDYDREIAIVVEQEQAGVRRFLGIGRLSADLPHDSAEFSVLVIDEFQSHGLGTLLTGYCLEIARKWGVRDITAETGSDNRRMLSIFQQFGFRVQVAESDVHGWSTLTARLEGE